MFARVREGLGTRLYILYIPSTYNGTLYIKHYDNTYDFMQLRQLPLLALVNTTHQFLHFAVYQNIVPACTQQIIIHFCVQQTLLSGLVYYILYSNHAVLGLPRIQDVVTYIPY